MNIITPVENGKHVSLDKDLRNSIFLAGPCPRKDYTDDWRFEAFDILKKLEFKGNVITPTNDKYNELEKNSALECQTKWEYEAMHKASVIVFWIPRSKEHPARTTNIEFGDWYNKPGVICGWPDTAEHNEYLCERLKIAGKTWYKTLEDTLKAAVDYLNRPANMWFTADTHFSQQRTLELSRRPFLNTWEMDLEMISNWNKNVTMNDTVYHAGDFGDISTMENILSSLNFKTLYWTLGNYDRPLKDKIKKMITNIDRDIIISENCHSFTHKDKSYFVVHEPVPNCDRPFTPKYPKYIGLYGHIHGRGFAKKNGFDLATDYHRFTPINIEQVEWFANAIQYWDENVFCKDVKVNF